MSVLIGSARVSVTPDARGFITELQAKLRADLATLDTAVPIRFNVDAASVAKARAALGPLAAGKSVPLKFDVNTASLAAADAATKALTADTNRSGQAANTAYRGYFGLFGLLGRRISLFGGGLEQQALGAVHAGFATAGAWHIALDTLAEIAAVVIPASVAVAAFGVAATDAVHNIVIQMTNMHTVTDATGRAMAPFTGNLERLHQAVQPQVYQLFGDALTIMAAKSGEFNVLARGTGTILDQLAARFTIAATKGRGLGVFLSQALPDLAKIGDVVGNLGGVFTNVFKALPGYATILLSIADEFSRFLEIASSAAVPLLKAGLALHGLFIWGGLAVTAVLKLQAPLTRLVTWVGGLVTATQAWAAAGRTAAAVNDATAASSTAAAAATGRQAAAQATLAAAAEGSAAAETSFAVASDGTAVAVDAASSSIWGLDAAMAALDAVNPLVWVGLAAAAIGAFIFAARSAKSATQQWAASMQDALQNAPVQSAIGTITTDLVAVNTRLDAATARLARTQQYVTQVNLKTGASTRVVSAAYTRQQAVVAQLTSAQRQLSDEGQLYNYRLGRLGKTYGGVNAAQGLLVASGITTKQMLDKSAESWAMIQVQVEGTVRGYKAMGQTGGTLGNDLQVLNSQATDQYLAMQKLNTAWDTFTANMTGTQNAFDTVALGMVTLHSSASHASTTLGHASLTIGSLGHAMDGLSKKDLALNQAFAAQVTNVNALADTWRTAGVSSNLFNRGIKDSIAPLVRFARGSKEGTAQLVGLAQEAGYNGPVSMSRLVKWLGNTHDATQRVKQITDQATVQEALLTSSMRNQGSFIANKLIGDINSAILAYDHVQAAATAYGNAIAKDGRQSDQARAARQRLINDLIKAGTAAGDSKTQIAEMIAKVLNIPLHRALEIVMRGDGSFKIAQTSGGEAPGGGGIGSHIFQRPAAAGAFVSAGTTPTADDVLARVSKGELIVPAKMVTAGLVDHLRGQIPGFQGGGLVETGNKAVLTGQYADTMYNSFTRSFEKAMVAAMKTAVTTAAARAAQAFGAAGPGGGAPAANAALARRMFPGEDFAAWNYVAMRESGWNQFARNPSSGAYGIAQALPESKYPFAGTAAGGSNPAAQISWMEGYMRSRYGGAAGAAAHERAFNWYDGGGWLPTGLSLSANMTGQKELVLSPGQLRQLGSGGGTTYIAQFPDEWAAGAMESRIRQGFTAMEINAGRKARIGRNS